jgi:hypothetical protein
MHVALAWDYAAKTQINNLTVFENNALRFTRTNSYADSPKPCQ